MKSPATAMKKEKRDHRRNDSERKPLTCFTNDDFESTHDQNVDERKRLRSGYGAILNLVKERTDDIGKAGSMKFKSIMDEIDQMHQLGRTKNEGAVTLIMVRREYLLKAELSHLEVPVKKPREQIADAEALLGLVGSVETSLRSGNNGVITPAGFVSRLLEKFGNEKKQIRWKELGLQVSPIFRSCRGCSTMLRPLKTEFKQRKVPIYRKPQVPIYRKPRTRRSTKAEPKQYNTSEKETDTVTNMAVMFEILKEKRTVELEKLLLNRKSFAQTVENLFALSFLVKDGRVLIAVDEKGSHFVSPRNAPHSGDVMSGEVVYSQFIFRFDFCDWKFMKALVAEGEELMPVRYGLKLQGTSQEELVPMSSQSELPSNISQAVKPPKSFQAVRTTPTKTYSRKLRVLEEKQMGKECPEVAGHGV